MRQISFLQVDRQFKSIKNEVMSAIADVIERGQFILGKEVEEFEKEVADYLKVNYAVSVANGTDALVLALRALDIGSGDEVITTPFTFFATAEAISRVGATPIFIDIDEETLNLDPSLIEKHITSKTKAILPVHLFGQSCNLKKISTIAKKHNLFIIEDACQAFGASYEDKKIGTIGDIGCFSFFPTKNFSTIGDGGLVVSNNPTIAQKIKKLRHHGSTKKYFHDEVGYNSRLDELHAAILRICLKKIDSWNNRRIELAHYYENHLKGLNTIKLPLPKATVKSHVYHLYCVECYNRNELMQYLDTCGIASGIYYPLPLHLQEVYRGLGYKKGDLPIAESKADRVLAIPLHPFLSNEEQLYIVKALQKFKEGES